MYNSLSMKYYGRGAGKIIMPRAVLRENRNEWFVKPSMVILIMAIACFFIVNKTIIKNKKLFKDTKTIILIPEAPPAPEPTVKKKITFMKVLKTAVKKTIAPKKLALKKIIAKKPKLKIKPKKIKPLEIKKKKLLRDKLKINKLDKKKIKPNKRPDKMLKARKLDKTKIKSNSPTVKHLKKNLPNLQHKPNKKALSHKPASNNRVKKNINHNKPAPDFHGLPQNRKTVSLPSQRNRQSSPMLNIQTKGPAPELRQVQKATSDQLAGRGRVPVSGPAQRTLNRGTAPIEDLYVPPSEGSDPIEEMVIIKSTALGNSSRVKNLKRQIMKKAKMMSSAKSPYQYKVNGYSCRVIIKPNKQVIIEFSPADASFNVVSRLERLLTR